MVLPQAVGPGLQCSNVSCGRRLAPLASSSRLKGVPKWRALGRRGMMCWAVQSQTRPGARSMNDPVHLLDPQDPSRYTADRSYNVAASPPSTPHTQPTPAAAASIGAAAAGGNSSPTSPVKISTKYHVDFGDTIKLVGSHASLGAWDPAQALGMTWSDGDVWTAAAQLPPGDHEFKVIVLKADGGLLWEPGDNRSVTVPQVVPTGRVVALDCAYGYTHNMVPAVATMDEETEAELEVKEEQQVAQTSAAAAVAKAMMTMDGEMEAKRKQSSDTDAEPLGVASIDSEFVVPAAAAVRPRVAPAVQRVQQQQQQQDEDFEDGLIGAAAAAALEKQASLELEEQLDAVHAQVLSSQAPAEVAATADDDASVSAADEAVAAAAVSDEPPAAAAAVVGSDVAAVWARATASGDSEDERQQPPEVAVVFRGDVTAERRQPPPPPPPAPKARAGQTTSDAASVVAAFMKKAAPSGAGIRVEESSPAAAAAAAEAAKPVMDAAAGGDGTRTAAAAAGAKAAERVRNAAASAAAAGSWEEAQTAADDETYGTETAAAEDVVFGVEAPAAETAALMEDMQIDEEQEEVESGDVVAVVVGSDGDLSGVIAQEPAEEAEPEGLEPVTADVAVPAAAAVDDDDDDDDDDGQLSVEDQPALTMQPTAAGDKVSPPVPISDSSAAAAADEPAAISKPYTMKPAAAAVVAAAAMDHDQLPAAAFVATAAAAALANPANWAADGPKSEVARRAEAVVAAAAAQLAAAQAARAAAAAAALEASKGLGGLSTGLLDQTMSTLDSLGSFDEDSSSLATLAYAGSAGYQGQVPAGLVAAAAATASLDESAAAPDAPAPGRSGPQLVGSLVGMAAVGTVLWSEFVLKETGCGLPPGPYGLLGAVEGLSYLGVLGLAGAGLAKRVRGEGGLPGPMAIPEGLAYGAVAVGLLALAHQMHEYGYIPPPLPGDRCFADAAVALPSVDLSAPLAGLQSLVQPLRDAFGLGSEQQEQLLQAQLLIQSARDQVAATVAEAQHLAAAGAHSLVEQSSDAAVQAGTVLHQLQDQVDLQGKLASQVQLLQGLEGQLVHVLAQQQEALQGLVGASVSMTSGAVDQLSTQAHVPELLVSIRSASGTLHEALATSVQQLGSLLEQLQGSMEGLAREAGSAAAAGEAATAAAATAQLTAVSGAVSDALLQLQQQLWGAYQQLALADHLTAMVAATRASAAQLAAATDDTVKNLHLEAKLQVLEAAVAGAIADLMSSAAAGLQQAQLDQNVMLLQEGAAATADSLVASATAGADALNAASEGFKERLPVLLQQLQRVQEGMVVGAQEAIAHSAGDGAKELQGLVQVLQENAVATARMAKALADANLEGAKGVLGKM